MRRRFLRNMEWGILICTIILIIIGMIALFSATQSSGLEEFKKQGIWILISIPIVIICIATDYNTLVKASPVMYGIMILLLIAVLFTKSVNGAHSWFSLGIFSFQPSEFAKIVVILFMALIMSKIQKDDKDNISKPLQLLKILAVLAVPLLLIIKQPDYGTAIAFVVATVLMLFTAGIRKRYIITGLILVVVAVPILYLYVLPEHAKTRIDVFLNPELGSGYNIIQSKLAIGSGEMFGMGLLKGNQTQLGFLYPKTTDFIFAVIGEEQGFIIAGAVIILYVILITKSIYVAKTAKDDVGSYIAIGIAGIFLFHMLENIGMTMGLLPITRSTITIC